MKTLLLSMLITSFVLVAGATLCVITNPTDTEMRNFGASALIIFLITVIFYKHLSYKENLQKLRNLIPTKFGFTD